MIEILHPGPFATIQDLGRIGQAALGVPRSGAFDTAALRAANRLVGNAESSAAIEFSFGGLRMCAHDAVTIALTGAVCPGAPGWGVALTLRGGTRLALGVPADGLRSYLAVRGGVDVTPILGSRSTDTLSGLGPAALRSGDLLRTGAANGDPADGAWVARARPPAHRVVLGPRTDWFTAEALAALLRSPWVVREQSDRVGLRLDGPRLQRAIDDELPSEPTVPGAIQVPPDGRPIVFGPDSPVTGGYPVIAVLRDLDGLAQLRPGDALRFTV